MRAPWNRNRGAAAAPVPDETHQRLVWRLAALLLDYPDTQTLAFLDRIRAEASALPEPAGPALLELAAHLACGDPTELAADYVQTFDLRRRNCLHLTYYAYGDTRKRGMALLRFKQVYRVAGVELGDSELPDHLPVVLEFAATVDPEAGRRLLVEYRAVLELLRRSLAESGSPYALVLDAVTATVGELSAPDRRRLAELAAEGPPAEEVGLEPFALDPALMGPAPSAADDHAGGRR